MIEHHLKCIQLAIEASGPKAAIHDILAAAAAFQAFAQTPQTMTATFALGPVRDRQGD